MLFTHYFFNRLFKNTFCRYSTCSGAIHVNWWLDAKLCLVSIVCIHRIVSFKRLKRVKFCPSPPNWPLFQKSTLLISAFSRCFRHSQKRSGLLSKWERDLIAATLLGMHHSSPFNAIELYVGKEYIQNNPVVADGKQVPNESKHDNTIF